jgi:hypothetical protein
MLTLTLYASAELALKRVHVVACGRVTCSVPNTVVPGRSVQQAGGEGQATGRRRRPCSGAWRRSRERRDPHKDAVLQENEDELTSVAETTIVQPSRARPATIIHARSAEDEIERARPRVQPPPLFCSLLPPPPLDAWTKSRARVASSRRRSVAAFRRRRARPPAAG